MTTKYKHRITLSCPSGLISAANQLALVAGESAADDQTFTSAGYEDVRGNLFAVASTVVTDNFLAVANGLPAELPAHAINADRELAQQALDAMVMWQEGATFDINSLTMAVGLTPQDTLVQWGLTQIVTEEI